MLACRYKPGLFGCIINGVCYARFAPDPTRQCWICNGVSVTDKFLPASGMPCDDGDPLTTNDTCVAGTCVGN